jgi:hypothetical protein
MPNQKDSNTPPTDPEHQPLSQGPVTPPAPHQKELRETAESGTQSKENETVRELEEDIRTGEHWLIRVGAAGVIMNVVIALIYYGQLTEMRKATRASEKAAAAAASAADTADKTLKEVRASSTDTHELSVQAKNQADRTKDVADRALTQAQATNELARQAKRSAEANKESADAAKIAANIAAAQLELAERPWVDASIVIDGPLTFTVNGLNIPLKLTLRNTGHSPAQSVNISYLPLVGHKSINATNYRGQVCESATKMSVNMGFGVSLFPDVLFEEHEGIGVGKEDIAAASLSKEFPDSKFPAVIMTPTMIVCIAYRPTFDQSRVYHTAYIFDLYKLDAQNRMGVMFKIGDDVDQDHWVIRRAIAQAITAD